MSVVERKVTEFLSTYTVADCIGDRCVTNKDFLRVTFSDKTCVEAYAHISHELIWLEYYKRDGQSVKVRSVYQRAYIKKEDGVFVSLCRQGLSVEWLRNR